MAKMANLVLMVMSDPMVQQVHLVPREKMGSLVPLAQMDSVENLDHKVLAEKLVVKEDLARLDLPVPRVLQDLEVK